MPGVNGRINTPIVPGTGSGAGGIAPARQPAIPGGSPGLLNPTGLSTRTSGGAAQLRNATLPPFGKPSGPSPMGPGLTPTSMSQTTAPKQPVSTLGAGTPLARPTAKPAGPRPMPTQAGPTAAQTSGPQKPLPTPIDTSSQRPQAQTGLPTPPHTSSLQGQKPAETGLSTPPLTPPATPTTTSNEPAGVGKTQQPALPTPMVATADSLMRQALSAAIEKGVDPMVAMQACMAVMGVEGGKAGMPAVALAQGEAGVEQAQISMDAAMDHMSQVMMMQMKNQTATALMKLIVDMNTALAKLIKEAGKAVSQLAG